MSKKQKLCMKNCIWRVIFQKSQQRPNKAVNLFIYPPSLSRSKHTSQCNEFLGDIWATAEHFPLLGKGTRLLHLCVFFRPGECWGLQRTFCQKSFRKKKQLEGVFYMQKHTKYPIVPKALFSSGRKNYSVNQGSCWSLVWEGGTLERSL